MVEIPSPEELRRGCEVFEANERRDAMYRTATFLVEHFWGQPQGMADSLGVLLVTWNNAFYRYGPFDYDKLEQAITEHQATLDGLRHRPIVSYSGADEIAVRGLFETLLDALVICEGRSKGRKSPVAVSKALHLLAPRFFPLWDQAIALAHRCDYSNRSADAYIRFMGIMKDWATALGSHAPPSAGGKSLLKRLDEYNYARFTKDWLLHSHTDVKA